MSPAPLAGRTQIAIDDQTYVLGVDRDLNEVMGQIEEAAGSSPAFVDLSSGDRRVSVLIVPTTRVVVSTTPEPWEQSEAMFPNSQVNDWDT
ncbi:hypothetical protein LJR044_002517 [Microbacterium foliorum]